MKLTAFLVAAVLLIDATVSGAGELTKDQQHSVERGLAWLARQQRRDGAWEAPADATPLPSLAWPVWPCSWREAPRAKAPTRDSFARPYTSSWAPVSATA